nr:hypothetical protein [Tanacetum cinerariifolium]
MHADLKYVESLEKAIDELESKKAEFSYMYDVILHDCVSKDVMCSYLMSLSDLDALDELQCLYLHKVKECDCLAQKLSNQIESVSKEVHNELLKRFAKVEKHSISLEIALQKRKEQGKSVDTKFDRPSVVRQPNAQRIPKPSVLGKPTPFSNSLDRIYFQKTRSVPKANVSEGLSKPVTAQTLPHTAKKAVSNTNVLKPGMYRINNRISHTKTSQLPQTVRNTNPRVSTSTGVNHKPTVSRPQLKRNQSRDKVLPNNSQVKLKKTQVEVHPRILSVSNKMKSVTTCKDSLNSRTLNDNAVCATCNKCLVDSNHFACVTKMLNDVHARTKKLNVVPISTRKPKNQANKSMATPSKRKVASKSTKQKPQSYFRVLYENTNKAWKLWIERQSPSGYKWVPKAKMQWDPICHLFHRLLTLLQIVQLILFIVDSGCTKHMTGNLKLLCNFVEKFLGTVRFGNDQFAPILGYGDLVQGNDTINRVYYVEGLNYNLFSVGQFCDADLEVAFRKSTCFVRDLHGNDLLTSNRGSDLYMISLQESTSSTPLCLMAKATPTQAWLWHRRLSYLNFGYINLLSKKDIVVGLPKLKYVKDQLCSSCELSKAKRSSFKSKTIPSSKGRLNLLHMDLCGPMQVASINGKKYIMIVQLILFIVEFGCTKHMTGNIKLLCNFVEKFLGTVRFGNDQFAPILGYGDLVQGNITINRVHYVEGLNHNLFSVGQFCDAYLEVAFRKSTCFVKDIQGNDLLTGNRGSDLYMISLQESTSSTPLCLMAKATPTQAWLWHRRLSHLNIDYINLLSKKDIMIGQSKLKYVKDQLCSSCELSKAKRSSFKLKAVPSSKGRLNLIHVDLCGPMRVASINGKKYILVIVDDYSRYT